jgi:hypothetical protein
MPEVGFEPIMRVLTRQRVVHALDRAAMMMDIVN